MKTALTIAGSDPTGGAGLQADLRTFHAFGVHGLGVPSALTAQNTTGVMSVNEVSDDFFRLQLETLLSDVRPDAVKTGMLHSAGVIEITALLAKRHGFENVVTDPVLLSSSGFPLTGEDGAEALKKLLFPLATVITPNMDEASFLTGSSMRDEGDMREGAVRLKALGPEYVIVTGGHLEGKALDLLYDGREFLTVERDRLEGHFHGTGCVFSSAIAACLALGQSVKEAFLQAGEFVHRALKAAHAPGRGMMIPGL